MKSHKQTKLKAKNLCVQVFRGLQSISLKIKYIYKDIYNFFIHLLVCLFIIYGVLVFIADSSVLFSVVFHLKLQAFPKRSVTFFFKSQTAILQ